jgi:diadenosine tetraphosphatase ApaH/serine/threonine PP2A family protein phosphatase
MIFGIFADIHSNLEGLQAVLLDMESCGVTHRVCLGDIIGYNANPKECLDLVRSLTCPILLGNHDEAATWDQDPVNFNALALESIRYSREQLDEEDLGFLKALPYEYENEGVQFVHANFEAPTTWSYILYPEDALGSFLQQKAAVSFFGHTHIPHLFLLEGEQVREYFYRKITLEPHLRYCVNVGSVGQPRDGDWRAAYVIYDTEAQTLELRRVEYDLATTQAKILRAGLSVRLADRLAKAT